MYNATIRIKFTKPIKTFLSQSINGAERFGDVVTFFLSANTTRTRNTLLLVYEVTYPDNDKTPMVQSITINNIPFCGDKQLLSPVRILPYRSDISRKKRKKRKIKFMKTGRRPKYRHKEFRPNSKTKPHRYRKRNLRKSKVSPVMESINSVRKLWKKFIAKTKTRSSGRKQGTTANIFPGLQLPRKIHHLEKDEGRRMSLPNSPIQIQRNQKHRDHVRRKQGTTNNMFPRRQFPPKKSLPERNEGRRVFRPNSPINIPRGKVNKDLNSEKPKPHSDRKDRQQRKHREHVRRKQGTTNNMFPRRQSPPKKSYPEKDEGRRVLRPHSPINIPRGKVNKDLNSEKPKPHFDRKDRERRKHTEHVRRKQGTTNNMFPRRQSPPKKSHPERDEGRRVLRPNSPLNIPRGRMDQHTNSRKPKSHFDRKDKVPVRRKPGTTNNLFPRGQFPRKKPHLEGNEGRRVLRPHSPINIPRGKVNKDLNSEKPKPHFDRKDRERRKHTEHVRRKQGTTNNMFPRRQSPPKKSYPEKDEGRRVLRPHSPINIPRGKVNKDLNSEKPKPHFDRKDRERRKHTEHVRRKQGTTNNMFPRRQSPPKKSHPERDEGRRVLRPNSPLNIPRGRMDQHTNSRKPKSHFDRKDKVPVRRKPGTTNNMFPRRQSPPKKSYPEKDEGRRVLRPNSPLNIPRGRMDQHTNSRKPKSHFDRKDKVPVRRKQGTTNNMFPRRQVPPKESHPARDEGRRNLRPNSPINIPRGKVKKDLNSEMPKPHFDRKDRQQRKHREHVRRKQGTTNNMFPRRQSPPKKSYPEKDEGRRVLRPNSPINIPRGKVNKDLNSEKPKPHFDRKHRDHVRRKQGTTNNLFPRRQFPPKESHTERDKGRRNVRPNSPINISSGKVNKNLNSEKPKPHVDRKDRERRKHTEHVRRKQGTTNNMFPRRQSPPKKSHPERDEGRRVLRPNSPLNIPRGKVDKDLNSEKPKPHFDRKDRQQRKHREPVRRKQGTTNNMFPRRQSSPKKSHPERDEGRRVLRPNSPLNIPRGRMDQHTNSRKPKSHFDRKDKVPVRRKPGTTNNMFPRRQVPPKESHPERDEGRRNLRPNSPINIPRGKVKKDLNSEMPKPHFDRKDRQQRKHREHVRRKQGTTNNMFPRRQSPPKKSYPEKDEGRRVLRPNSPINIPRGKVNKDLNSEKPKPHFDRKHRDHVRRKQGTTNNLFPRRQFPPKEYHTERDKGRRNVRPNSPINISSGKVNKNLNSEKPKPHVDRKDRERRKHTEHVRRKQGTTNNMFPRRQSPPKKSHPERDEGRRVLRPNSPLNIPRGKVDKDLNSEKPKPHFDRKDRQQRKHREPVRRKQGTTNNMFPRRQSSPKKSHPERDEGRRVLRPNSPLNIPRGRMDQHTNSRKPKSHFDRKDKVPVRRKPGTTNNMFPRRQVPPKESHPARDEGRRNLRPNFPINIPKEK